MKEYPSTHIRNVAVVGHGGSGKTSLVDALAFVAGSSKRHGRIKEGSALTDYSPDEIERGYSINLALAHAEWEGVKINLVDTPGYLDFAGDAMAGMYAADASLIVLGASAGVETGTEKVWEYSRTCEHEAIFFVSMMDKEHADFSKVYGQIRERLTPKAIPVEIPIGAGPQHRGIINLISKTALIYKPGTKTGEYDEQPIPKEMQAEYEKYESDLIETVASTDDSLVERYLEGKEIAHDELVTAMRAAMKRRELFPILCGAAELTYGDAGAALGDRGAGAAAGRQPPGHGREVGQRREAGDPGARRRAVHGPGVQDRVRAARRRRVAVPDLLRGSSRTGRRSTTRPGARRRS